MGLVDTGNTVPGSAAISVALAKELGVKIIPSQLQVTTAAQCSQLEVVGTVASLIMGITAKTFLRLRNVLTPKLRPLINKPTRNIHLDSAIYN